MLIKWYKYFSYAATTTRTNASAIKIETIVELFIRDIFEIILSRSFVFVFIFCFILLYSTSILSLRSN